MTTPADIYINGIKKKLKNYWAAWLPSTRFKLGDIGVLNGKIFEKICHLEDLGIKYDIDEGKDPSPIDYVSESGVVVNIKLAGETNDVFGSIPKAKAGIGVSFDKKGAFVVQAEETYESSIKNIIKLQNQIIPAFKDGGWEKSWTTIARIVTAPSATFLISNSSMSKIELSAEGDLGDGLLELGKAEGQFGLVSQHGDVLKIIGAKNVTPFFQIAKIKRKLFSSYSFSTKSFSPERSGIDFISPKLVREKAEIESSLYLDICLDTEVYY